MRDKLLFEIIPVIKNNTYVSFLAMPVACLPLLSVFCCFEACGIAEFLAARTPHLIRGAIGIHIEK